MSTGAAMRWSGFIIMELRTARIHPNEVILILPRNAGSRSRDLEGAYHELMNDTNLVEFISNIHDTARETCIQDGIIAKPCTC